MVQPALPTGAVPPVKDKGQGQVVAPDLPVARAQELGQVGVVQVERVAAGIFSR
jgi:hypothetical protein